MISQTLLGYIYIRGSFETLLSAIDNFCLKKLNQINSAKFLSKIPLHQFLSEMNSESSTKKTSP